MEVMPGEDKQLDLRRLSGNHVVFTTDELETKIKSLLTGDTVRGYNAHA
jgi:hypothetical protein